jgi:peptidoglycan/LPS O-acetylase OafA/YrhL
VTQRRDDIDGLRAIAVLPVMLFHLGVESFGGGFVGVDVFFVISGFLITSIILPSLRQGTFTLLDFYERRCRRLFPALFTVLAASTVAAVCLLMPYDLQKFGESLAASIGFASNFVFASQVGYFDDRAITKPLLHTWSLAVEEQFYIVYPFILALALRYVPSRLTAVLAGLALLSLAFSVEAVWNARDGAYYYLHVRGFELLLGALVAAAALPKLRSAALTNAASVAGLAMITAAVFLFDANTPFPGVAALLPCLGTAVLLHAGADGVGAVQKLLGTPVLVAIGRISYPIYLWHWPLIVFTAYVAMRLPTAFEQAAIVLATLVLAALTWRFIERPFQTRRWLPSAQTLFRMAIPSSLSLAVLGGALALLNGLPQRLPAEAARADEFRHSQATLRQHCSKPDSQSSDRLPCYIGDMRAARADFALIGDSHAEAVAMALGERAQAYGLKGVVFTRGRCVPLLAVRRPKQDYCTDYMKFAYDTVAKMGITNVILVSRWLIYVGTPDPMNPPLVALDDGAMPTDNAAVIARGLERSLAFLPGKRVTILAGIPEIGFPPPSVIARTLSFGLSPPSPPTLAAYRRQQSEVLAVLNAAASGARAQILDPTGLLCPDGQCRITDGGRILYFDENHLSRDGARLLAPVFDDALRTTAADRPIGNTVSQIGRDP